MTYNSDRRKKRLSASKNNDSDYKFNKETTPYDRVMTVLNKQQERILAMLKKYSDDDHDQDLISHHTMQLQSIKAESMTRNLSTVNADGTKLTKEQELHDRRTRVNASLPVRKKHPASNTRREVYQLYDMYEGKLPAVTSARSVSEKRNISLGSSDRRSKVEVIEEVYIQKPQAKSKRKRQQLLAEDKFLLTPTT